MKYFAFRWVEFHLPLSFPGGKIVQVFLQLAGVINTVDLPVNSSIISEKTDKRVSYRLG